MKTSRTSNGAKNVTLSRSEAVATRLAGATCASCVYLFPGRDAHWVGECHRSAPAAGLVQLATQQGGVSTLTRPTWPLVRSTDSCGDFLRRPR